MALRVKKGGTKMKTMLKVTPSFLIGLFLIIACESVSAQTMSVEQIKNNLLSNPPNTGNSIIRKESILALDQILLSDSGRRSKSISDLYTSMMQKVKNELQDEVKSGASIWMMYNDGYLVKTPELVFAFDVITGHWGITALPLDVIDQIKVLFVSHSHNDHADGVIIDRVMKNGGYVVYPSEEATMSPPRVLGNVPMAVNARRVLEGLSIKALNGYHGDIPLRMYEVVTPDGLKFFHTGDNGTSATVPIMYNLDVLFLNAWVNENGNNWPWVSMRSCMAKLNPKIMIPGHIHELGHIDLGYDPVPYQFVYNITDTSVAGKTRVMIWGELYTITKNTTSISEEMNYAALMSSQLSQNYPNPFNPSTIIQYSLPKPGYVTLKIYNTLGQEVAQLVSQRMDAGTYTEEWNASGFTSGVYYYKLEAGGFIETKKLVLLR
jgi:L-ascorbate metabolism protein UlaG (beta-lactamase superfamily)